jgi:hypothetical protein
MSVLRQLLPAWHQSHFKVISHAVLTWNKSHTPPQRHSRCSIGLVPGDILYVLMGQIQVVALEMLCLLGSHITRPFFFLRWCRCPATHGDMHMWSTLAWGQSTWLIIAMLHVPGTLNCAHILKYLDTCAHMRPYSMQSGTLVVKAAKVQDIVSFHPVPHCQV